MFLGKVAHNLEFAALFLHENLHGEGDFLLDPCVSIPVDVFLAHFEEERGVEVCVEFQLVDSVQGHFRGDEPFILFYHGIADACIPVAVRRAGKPGAFLLCYAPLLGIGQLRGAF